METSRRSDLTIVLNTFFICVIAYFIEYKFFYLKSISIFGSTIISKIFGIFAILVAMYFLRAKWKNIGYIKKSKKIISGIITPVLILAVCSFVSFLFIKLLVQSQGGSIDASYRVSHSSLDPSESASFISFIIALISSLISSFMIETLLRGLVLQTANKHLRFYASNTIAVALTIVWYNIIYIFNIAFGVMTTTDFIRSMICSTVIYAAAAIRRSLYIRSSGAIWACLVDCFLSMVVINNLSLTINLPADFVPTNPIGYLVSFMSSKLNNSYASIAFMGLASVLSLVIMIIYCGILKKRARNKYLKRISQNNATENN